jgi:UDP-N-acetyl-D-glucosamine dehydrogenase
MEKLRDAGADVAYSDPHVPVFPHTRKHQFHLSGIELTSANMADFDCVLLATDHDKFDYAMIKESAKLIVDCRGRYLAPAAHITKA